MAAVRRRTTNIARRRRTDDDDDENRSVATLVDDDSQSDEVSVLSDVDADADADADNSDLSDVDSTPVRTRKKGGHVAAVQQVRQPSPPIARSQPTRPAPAPAATVETLGERRRREHDEYKKKRDSDPSFIPNRGAFFMHDHRHAPGHGGFRPMGGRGRGRGTAVGGPPYPIKVTDSPWQHDLHETVNIHHHAARAAPPPAMALPVAKPSPSRNFSTTVHTHNALVRVFLPGMKAPITFQNVPIKQHTRLPNHRPPLRRDKPVRISLPPAPPRYLFPTIERSFIFIPRAMRPNQQGFGRGRGRFGSFSAAQGGPTSRRTSMYGGSAYSPSVAMSRRSSMAREIGREGLVSPAGSILSRNGGFTDLSRPVVRLPPGGGPRMPTGPSMMVATHPVPNYPLPQKPAFRENWQGQLPIHQPRPQKTVSVAGIESPATMNFNPPQQQEQQPFHQQVPTHINGTTAPEEQQQPTLSQLQPQPQPQPQQQSQSQPQSQSQSQPQPYYQHARQASFPNQESIGTPLSNIPERAIHAPAFQPYAQAGFPPQPFVPQPYYYPPTGAQPQYMGPTGMIPMFIPGAQPPGYVVPVTAPPLAAPPVAPVAGPSNMVAYESNGMTYYVDSASLYPPPPIPVAVPTTGAGTGTSNGAAPTPLQAVDASYSQPSFAVSGMGGMMTPGPDGAYYYPPSMAQGFYPPQ